MSDNFKYYGFYSRKGNTDIINRRPSRQKASNNSQFNEKEFGVYVHTEYPEIIEHLDEEYNHKDTTGHYIFVKNLTFMPIKGLSSEDERKVQNLINVCYTFFHISEQDDRISWAKMHALGREYMHSGYNSELSKEIMDLIAKEATTQIGNTTLNEEQKKNLLIQSERTCDKIHIVDHLKKEETKDYNKIILEDYILKKGEKQLILGFFGNDDIKQYENNPYIYDEPWLFSSTELGFFIWNLMINKASMKCISDHSTTLFPIQFILSTHPNYLFYEQIDKKNNIIYIGYFIARIKFDKLEKTSFGDFNCKKIYNYEKNKPNDCIEQYFVIFVFKNLDDTKYDVNRYILTDFRLQRIHWGNLTRSKRVLFIEIQQLMCSYFKEEGINKIYFYLISEYEQGTNQSVNEICKTQEEEINILKIELKEKEINILKKKLEKEKNINEIKNINDEINNKEIELGDLTKKINNKIKNKDCYQAWLHKDTISKLNEHEIKLKDNSYKIFIAKKDLNGIYEELVLRNEKTIQEGKIVFNTSYDDQDFKHLIITENISVKKYILLSCHFKWETIDKKEIFVLKHGDLKWNEYDLRMTEDCLDGTSILNREIVIHTMKNIELFNNIGKPEIYVNKLEEINTELFGGYNETNKINKLIKKIKIYKSNLKHIIFANPSLYYNEGLSKYNNIGFNLDGIMTKILNIKIKYSDIDDYINKRLLHFIPSIQHINNGNILIFSNNINMLLLCEKYLNIENNIFLIFIDINLQINIKHILFNKNKIKIYYFGNILNNELINNIINFFPNTKFNNIIFDITYDSEQIFYNILSIKICKNLLLDNGTFIQFTKIPNFKDNLIYLHYFIFKCFKYNIIDNHTSYLFFDNMYSLLFHKNFNYNLNDNEENIINNLLNSEKNNLLKNITLDKLFIDYLYIAYLNIYYTLQNTAEKIFKTSYKYLENKIKNNTEQLAIHLPNASEQHGGYQINNKTKLEYDLKYNIKYSCTFLEKQLFLLHLNFLTKVYLHENKNLDNFYIYYDAKDYGYEFYQDILKNMFKQLTWTNTNDKNKECIFISNNLDMYHKIKPKYALMDLKLDTDNNFFDGEILYTLYPFSNTDLKILVKEYNKIKKYSDNIFQELLDNNKFFNLCYNYDLYNINKVIPIKYLKLIPGYTDNFECILEYKILYNYLYRIHDITDHKIIMNKLFDITIDNENNIKYWINCTLNKFQNAENETDIMFKNIVQLNIEQHAKNQIQLLKEYGLEVLDKQKISKAIKILEKYASDRVYIQIL